MEEVIIKGKKKNMSQVFLEDGTVVPVTIVIADAAFESEDLEGKPITIVGKSKGKGFTGVMKKWNFAGQQATRGQSDKPRAAGSIGAQTPGRVFKGKKMAGRHGNKKVTLKSSKVIKVFPESNELMVSGPIPGARNSAVILKVK
ncbi:MAG: 50S ribosomal protein L3 [Patescibacteria group bacterium]